MPHCERCAWPEGARAQIRRHGRFLVLLRCKPCFGMSACMLLLWAGMASAQNQGDPKELLLRVREKVMNTVGRLPKYVCTQTVDRTRYEPANPEYGTNGTSRHRACDDTVADARRGNGRIDLDAPAVA